MKIAWIVTNINQLGGIEKVVCCLSNQFACKEKLSVQIISIFTKETNTFYPLEDNVTVKHLNYDWRTDSRLKFTRMIGKLMSSIDADIIMTCHHRTSYAVLLNRWRFKGKVVVTQHITNDCFTTKVRIANKIMFRFADKFIVLTKSDKQQYEKALCKAEIIRNANFDTVANPSGLTEKTILAAGRLEAVFP